MANIELGTAYINVVVGTADIAAGVNRQLAPVVAVAERTGRRAGAALSSGLAAANPGQAAQRDIQRLSQVVDKAAADVTEARRRESDAARKVAIEEAKLRELRDKGTATASQILAAEDRLQRARYAGESATQRATRAVTAHEAAVRDLGEVQARAAEAPNQVEYTGWLGRIKGAMKKIRDQVENGMEAASSEAADGGERAGKSWSEGIKKHLVFDVSGLVEKGVGAVTDAFKAGFERLDVQTNLNGAFADTPGMAAKVGDAAGKAYAAAWGDSYEQSAAVTAAISTSFTDATSMTSDQVAKTTGKVMAVAKANGLEAERLVSAIGVTMQSGLADSSEGALDIMSSALQKMPMAVRDELLESSTEYSKFFNQLGISGPQAFGSLAEASKLGMYGIDKTGDAVKEFTIRATDLSKSTSNAYTALGLNTTEMTNALLAGGEQAQGAFSKIVGGLKGIKDPGQQAAASLALFGTPLEDIGTDKIPDFLNALSTGSQGLSGFEGSADRVAKAMKGPTAGFTTLKRSLEGGFQKILSELSPTFTAIGNAISTNAGPWIEKLSGYASTAGAGLKDMAIWVKENASAFLPAAVGIGLFATGMGAYTLATKIATGAQNLFNAAMALGNKIMQMSLFGKILLVISAVAAGLTLLYQKNETFRNFVNAAWQSIQQVVGAVASWFTETALPKIRQVMQWIGEKATWLYENAIKPAWDGISSAIGKFVSWWRDTAWPAISAVFTWIGDTATAFYTNVMKPIFEFIGALISAWWNYVVKPIFAAVVWFIQTVLAPVFTWLWQTVISPAFQFIGALISAWWNATVKPIFDGAKWFFENVLGPVFTWLWQKVIVPVFNGIGSKISDVWMNTIKPALEAGKRFLDNDLGPAFNNFKATASKAWSDFSGAFKSTWDWLKTNVLDPIGTFFSVTFPGWFTTAKQSIQNIWNGFVATVGSPIKTVIDAVIRPLAGGINSLLGFVGITSTITIPPVNLAGAPTGSPMRTASNRGGQQAFAEGGIVPGARSVGRDNQQYINVATGAGLALAGHEGILHQYGVDAFGRAEFLRFNAISRDRGPAAGRDYLHRMTHGFAAGGLLSPAAARRATGDWRDPLADIGEAVSGAANAAWQGTKYAAGKAWEGAQWLGDKTIAAGSALAGYASTAAEALTNPGAILSEIVKRNWPQLAAAGNFLSMLAGTPRAMIDKAVPFVLGKRDKAASDAKAAQQSASPGASGPLPGAPAGQPYGWQAIRRVGLAPFPGITFTSGLRPGARTAAGGYASLHALGRAGDFAAPMTAAGKALMARMFHWWDKNYKPSELLYSPMGSNQLNRGHRRGDTSGITKAMHYNHVHVGFNQGGVLDGLGAKIAATSGKMRLPRFDQGGLLTGKGDRIISKQVAEPERVLSPRQTQQFDQLVSGPGAGIDYARLGAAVADALQNRRLGDININNYGGPSNIDALDKAARDARFAWSGL